MDIIPAKTIAETHAEYMQNFVNLLVETTQQSSEFEQLDADTKALFHKIIDSCRQPMVVAAKNRHASSQIFIYLIADRTDVTYNLLFPSGNMKATMDKFSIKPVFQQVAEHLAPLHVEHKIYELYKSSVIEVKNYTEEFICEPEPPVEGPLDELYGDGVKKLDPVRRYVGVITVSWSKFV